MFDKLEDLVLRYEELMNELNDPDVVNDQKRFRKIMKEQNDLAPIVEAYNAYKQAKQDVEDSLAILDTESDEEMRELAKEELNDAKERIESLEKELKILLLPKDPNDDKDIVMEIRAGAGGDEAALFAAELFRMYTHYIESRGWKVEVVNADETGIGGMKEVEFMVKGQGAYSVLKYESGVHRVQRVPETESGGRIHTSTASVQAKQSWWEDKATFYTQDKDGAYFIYNMPCSEEDYEKLVPGTKIKVTGYKAEWSGEIEVADVSSFEIEDGEYIAEPLDVTDLLGKDELIDHQNELVSFKGMTVEAAGQDADGNDVAYLYNYDGSGSEGDDLYFNVSLNGETYTFTVESYLCDKDSDVYKAVEALNIGDKIDMEGFLYWYEGVNPHITSVTAAE